MAILTRIINSIIKIGSSYDRQINAPFTLGFSVSLLNTSPEALIELVVPILKPVSMDTQIRHSPPKLPEEVMKNIWEFWGQS